MPDKARGAFVADWWVSCGVCNETQHLDTMGHEGNRTAAAFTLGYRHTTKHGWLCPVCFEKQPPRGFTAEEWAAVERFAAQAPKQ